MIHSFKDLLVYQKAFEQAMRVFEVTKRFPKAEQFSLDFSEQCAYIDSAVHAQFSVEYEQIGKMLGKMISAPEKFCYTDRRAAS